MSSLAIEISSSPWILREELRVAVLAHASPKGLALAFDILQQDGLLTTDNCAIVAVHEAPCILAGAFSTLQAAGLFTSDNRACVAAHAHPYSLAKVLSTLGQAGLLTDEHRAIVARHAYPDHLAKALSTLNEAGLLTSDNRAIVVANKYPYDLVVAFSCLQRAKVLIQENFNIVTAHAHPAILAAMLSILQHAGLLTSDNRAILVEHASLNNLTRAFFALRRAGLLTQDNFSALMLPNHAALLTRAARRDRIWNRIPQHFLTQANYQRLLTAAEHANPLQELRRVTNEIIGFVPGVAAGGAGGPEPVFNNRQSTHMEPIHRSVSESAIKLMARYRVGLRLDATIADIKTWVSGLDDSPRNAAAKRCIQRITAPLYILKDLSSRVSTQELLALAYIAIHDETKRQGSLEDAKDLFVEGLYEIQRGYNIEREQGPSEGNDLPICPGGTFNKLMEKLSGIHPDVEVSYITHEGASSKFTKLVQAYAMAHLKTLASPMNAADYQAIKVVLDTLEREKNIGCIWEKIKEAVRTELWDEFKEAYSGNQNNARFTSMIEYGGQNAVPDLSEIKAQLASSAGYQASVIEPVVEPSQASLSTQGFWALQHASGVEQQSFVYEHRYG